MTWVLAIGILVAAALAAWSLWDALRSPERWARLGLLGLFAFLMTWASLAVVKVIGVVAEEGTWAEKAADALTIWEVIPFGVIVGWAVVALRDRVKRGADTVIDARSKALADKE